MGIQEIVLAFFAMLLALGSAGGSLYLIVRARRWLAGVRAGLAAPRAPFWPPATLLIPVGGEWEVLEGNLRALLSQEYPDLQTVLVLDSRSDPLFAAVERLASEVAADRARVVSAEDRPLVATASGKCAAQLRGLEEVRPSSEVLVFADDDIRPPREWLAKLIEPLRDEAVGVTTAYRWYFSRGGGLASHIRAAWNLVGLQILLDPKWNFAWGGGMALRRKDFDTWEIARDWARAISDDYVVTIAAKSRNRPIVFIPRTLAPAYEHADGRTLLKWSSRQAFMTRIYHPELWRFALVPYLFFNGLMIIGLVILILALAGIALPFWALLAAGAFALHLPLNLAKAAVFYRGVREMMPDHDREMRDLRGAYLIGTVFAPFVTIYALAKTRDLRLIEWRGKKYEVKGPLDVRPL